jgi:SAM-dependent methyltransferase
VSARPDRPSIRAGLEELVVGALRVDYVSTSCKDDVKTGNHYQSVAVGALGTTGFRESRDDYLDRIAFDGKKVLDLGSNLGELSRAARARGAWLVDGFEYDPFFIEVASALNALGSSTRVSFFQRDITDPSVFQEGYDIVLAFSVWHYIGPLVEEIASITREMLVVETHRLDGNLESDYITPLRRYLPAYRILGYSKWKESGEQGERRAVMAFARDEERLAACLTSGVSPSATPLVT